MSWSGGWVGCSEVVIYGGVGQRLIRPCADTADPLVTLSVCSISIQIGQVHPKGRVPKMEYLLRAVLAGTNARTGPHQVPKPVTALAV